VGVTIHFKGTLKDSAAYEGLLAIVSSTAEAKGWPIELIGRKTVTRLRVDDNEQAWNYEGPVEGIVVRPHEDCEPVRFEFDQDLYVQEYTKTQFAGVACHLAVVALLRRVEPLFSKLVVDDEGEFWNTGDLAVLENHVETIRKVINDELKKNPNARAKVRTPDGRLVDLIT
jgi:hypothetical protein